MAHRLAAVLSLIFVGLFVLTPVYVVGVNVTFTLTKKVSFGRGIVVTGDVAALGSWTPASGVQLKVDTTTEVDWSASVDLDASAGTIVEYKPVTTDYGTGNNPVWFPAFNLVFAVPDGDTLLVPINWPDLALCPSVQAM